MTSIESVEGVGPVAAKKLREVFVSSAELLAVQNPSQLHAKTNLGEGTCLKIVRNARQLVGTFGFMSGLDVEKAMATKPRLKTGVAEVDAYLLGGIEAGTIVELFGPARGGKTQWCAQLAVRAQMPLEQGGLGGRVLWLDTEGSFEPHIIRAVAYRFGLDPDVVLDNIGRAEVVLSTQMSELFETIPQLCMDQGRRLVIVDSLTGLFRVEYTSLDQLRVRQRDINQLLSQMRRAAVATGCIFVYTNQVMANISPISKNPLIPVGGHVLAHGSDYRFYTKRKMKDIREIELQDNAGIPEFKSDVLIGWGGLYGSAKEKAEMEPRVQEYLRSRGIQTTVDKADDDSKRRGKSGRAKRKEVEYDEEEEEETEE
ncbi:MAG: AAA family ATPase [Candidatus Thorarchaeota archaeon]|nr:AAA family ATPase [Candidatus Thorarchaeota archaeon]